MDKSIVSPFLTHVVQPFYASWTVSGTIRVSRHQEGKTNLDLLEQETVSGSDIPPLRFLQVGCPPCCPTNSVKALKATEPVLLR